MVVQQAGMGSDLEPAGTEESQANELGWESPARSWAATYFAGWQMGGGGQHMCLIHRKGVSEELSLAQPKPGVFSCP